MKSKDAYASDAPLTSREKDRLKRWPFAARIAETLATRSDPTSLVIGVYGRWGEGKTTVLEFIAQALEEEEHVVVVRFNPWLYTNDTDLFRGFFTQVADAIERELTKSTETIGTVVKALGTLISGVTVGVGGVTVGAGGGLAALGGDLTNVSIQELRTRLETGLEEEKKRVVVLLDDIDRLDKHEAQAVFRLLKVAADFKWTAYVLAMDRDIVAASLAERYPGRMDGGGEFLDKIVQVPLPVPAAPREVLRRFLFKELERVLDDGKLELNDADATRLVTAFDTHLLRRVETPRAIKRYLNAIEFALPMLRGEVDVVDLLIIEAIRVFHPRLHDLVRQHREIVVGSLGEPSKEAINAFREKVEKAAPAGETQDGLPLLKKLFPRLEQLYGNNSFSDAALKRWAKQKRIASPDYFSRYFAAGVPIGDVADGEMKELVALAVHEPHKAAPMITALLDHVEADRLVQKLVDASGETSGHDALVLARALIQVGARFPRARGSLADYVSPQNRVAHLVAELLGRAVRGGVTVPDELLQSAPMSFAFRVLRELQPSEPKEERAANARPAAEALWQSTGAGLLRRVHDDASKQWPFDHGFEEGAQRLSVWRQFGGLPELREYARDHVLSDPGRALQLVRMFTSNWRDISSGEGHQDAIDRQRYDRLAEIVDPGVIAAALVQLYGAPPETARQSMFVQSDAELAHSFLQMHASASDMTAPEGS